MVVPTQDQLHRSLLEIAAATGEIWSAQQFLESITSRLSLTQADLAEKTSTGSFRVRVNIAFALSLLKRAGLLQLPSRGRYQIAPMSRDFLKTHHGILTITMLRRMVLEQRPGDKEALTDIVSKNQSADDAAPEDKIEDGYIALQEKLVDDILESISQISPDAFERLVVDLLQKMGYGKGETVGRSSDGGIDGIINQDALGLEKVYIQAKRWQSQVGEPEIRNFSGSLDARGASKGVFVTTSSFSGNAKQTGQIISAGNKFIRLIDGPELAKLMLAHEVGVITQYTYKIQKLDENYFAEES